MVGTRRNPSAPENWPIVASISNETNGRNMADPNAQNAINGNGNVPTNPVEIWSENPVTEEFNPGTSTGQKIFLLLSKGPDDGKKCSLSPTEAQEFMSFIRSKASSCSIAQSDVDQEED